MELTAFERRQYLLSQRPIDDLMFRVCAQDRQWCQEVLRAIFQDGGLVVIENHVQFYLENIKCRSLFLDALCVLGDGRTVNVEVQRESKGDHQRRVRLHASLLTAKLSRPNMLFGDIPDVCVVYICEFDIFEQNAVLYHVGRVLRESGKRLNNGFTEIYVNAKARDNTDLAELMRLFTEPEAYNEEKFPRVTEIKRLCREFDEGGNNIMDAVLEEMLQEREARGEANGEARGKIKGMLSAFIDLVKDNQLSITEACRRAKMTESQFRALMDKYESGAAPV